MPSFLECEHEQSKILVPEVVVEPGPQLVGFASKLPGAIDLTLALEEVGHRALSCENVALHLH